MSRNIWRKLVVMKEPGECLPVPHLYLCPLFHEYVEISWQFSAFIYRGPARGKADADLFFVQKKVEDGVPKSRKRKAVDKEPVKKRKKPITTAKQRKRNAALVERTVEKMKTAPSESEENSCPKLDLWGEPAKSELHAHELCVMEWSVMVMEGDRWVHVRAWVCVYVCNSDFVNGEFFIACVHVC